LQLICITHFRDDFLRVGNTEWVRDRETSVQFNTSRIYFIVKKITCGHTRTQFLLTNESKSCEVCSESVLFCDPYFGYNIGEFWLRAGRPRGRSSSPGEVKNFFFCALCRPALGPTGTGGSFREGKAAGEWSWPHTSNYCRGQEDVGLYIHSHYFSQARRPSRLLVCSRVASPRLRSQLKRLLQQAGCYERRA
jgi:hypothetical protein